MTSAPPTIFLAHKYQEAAYWAERWGFGRRDWKWVARPDQVRGYRPVHVYVCGSGLIPYEVQTYLELFGTTFIDAHDHPTDFEPASALQHLVVL